MREDRYMVEQLFKNHLLEWEWQIVYTSENYVDALGEWQRASQFGRKVRLTDTQSKG